MTRTRISLATGLLLLLLTITTGLAWAEGVQKININTAPVEELVKLKNIGMKYAQRIVAYREANGPFAKSEDLMKVSGIGPKILELNKDVIAVAEPQPVKG